MKKLCLLVLAAISLSSCWTTRIWTVAPTAEPVAPVQTVYTTQVTTPSKQTTVTTFTVTGYNTDMCFYLDLNAVAAAYAESHSVREFEQILNSSRYMINNLDLNRDGWIDYLRVIETRNGCYHALLIQSCLAPGVFQDVATLVAERRADLLYVEVIGDPYLYGYNYIVRPVFIQRPPMWNTYGQAGYAVWSSPYYYGYYPSYYTQPKPIYLNHYQAYVNTYMSNHHYCHYCDYPDHVFYSGYTTMTQPHHRNDYSNAHPEQSFERRVTQTIGASNTNGVSVRNAGQLRSAVNKEQAKQEETKSNTSTSTRTNTTTTTGTTSTTGTTTSTRSNNTSATTTTTNKSNASSTTTKPSTSTSTRSNTTTTRPSTTVDTRVKSSGTTRTTIKTTDSNGRTTSVKRETSNVKRETNSSTRSTNQNSSTRSSQGPSKESNPRSSQPSR